MLQCSKSQEVFCRELPLIFSLVFLSVNKVHSILLKEIKMDLVTLGLAVLAAIVILVIATHKPKKQIVVDTTAKEVEAPAQESAPVAVEPAKEVTSVASKPARAKKPATATAKPKAKAPAKAPAKAKAKAPAKATAKAKAKAPAKAKKSASK